MDEKQYYTNKTHIKELYRLMYNIQKIFIENGIFYCAVFGTLLGAVRHKGVIPWDDDIDLIIGNKDACKVLQADTKKKFSKAGYQIKDLRKNKEYGWVKIYNKKYKKVFADLFLCEIIKEKGYYRTKWVSDVANELWSKSWFKVSELLPLKKYKFGGSYILGPKNAIPNLNRYFGKSWSKKGMITQDIHHNELDDPIVLKKGQFKPAKPFYSPPKAIKVNELYLQDKLVGFVK